MSLNFKLGVAALALCLAPLVPAQAAPAEDIARFETAFAPTGMAVVVIEDGKVSHVHTSGVLTAGRPEKVNGTTRFTIASMGKAFVAAGLAALVDDGRIKWDDPVIQHLPEFRTTDPYVTQHLTVRDLLSHRSGSPLGAGDLLTWPDGQASVGDAVKAVAHLPIGGFRERFIYSNTMYRVAGALIEAVSGQTWDGFIAGRILMPLGMTGCEIDPRKADERFVARQHIRTTPKDRPQAITGLVEYPDPAGGMVCTIEDLGKWALFQLGEVDGRDGKPVLNSQRLAEMHQGVIPRRVSGQVRRLAGANLGLYGLGWEVSDFHGQLLVEHGGQATGGLSHIALLPGRKAAVVTVANDNATPVSTLGYQLMARVAAGDESKDWVGDLAVRIANMKPPATDGSADSAPKIDVPAARLAEFAGTYRDPWYGDIAVTQNRKGLRIHLKRSRLLDGPLVPVGRDQFVAQWPNRGLNADAEVTFQRDSNGQIVGMLLRAVSEDTDFSYDFHDLKPIRVREVNGK